MVDALLENLEKALARIPVKTGPADKPVEMYVYRGEVANNAIKLAGLEIGMFTGKSEIRHRNSRFAHLSDEELVQQLRDEANSILEQYDVKMIDVTPEHGDD